MTASASLLRRAIDLVALGTFACVVAWCVEQAGADSPVLQLVSGIIAVASAVVVFAATRSEFRWLAILPPLVVGALAIAPLGSLALKLNAALLLVIAVVGMLWPLGVRALAALVLLAAGASLVAGVVPGRRELPKLLAIRNQIQVESLDARLGYERQRFPNLGAPGPTLSDRAAKNLELAELTCFWDQEPRHYVVERMLDRQLELWVRGIGLADPHLSNSLSGYAMFPKPSLRKVSFREPTSPESDSANTARPFICPAYNATPTERLHIAYRDDFLAPTYYGGFVEPLEQLADFVPHGIHRSPAGDRELTKAWTIERLELISLSRFAEPRAYVLDYMPRMDELSKSSVATRPLDTFEAAALPRLRADEDVIVEDEKEDKARMLGSIRTARQCAQCHRAPRGELLGAFSYWLQRVPAADAAGNTK